ATLAAAVCILPALAGVPGVAEGAPTDPTAQLQIQGNSPQSLLDQAESRPMNNVFKPFASDIFEDDPAFLPSNDDVSNSIVGPIITEEALESGRMGLGLDYSTWTADDGFNLLDSTIPSSWALSMGISPSGVPIRGHYEPGAWLGSASPHLTSVVTFGVGENGETEFHVMRFSNPDWKEMDGWEKVGYVTAKASAVAGMLIILAEILN
ncbi:MAG: hypothetical protein GY906_25980, partial [bacterium]|nr:hypothetical protein [bacterium]